MTAAAAPRESSSSSTEQLCPCPPGVPPRYVSRTGQRSALQISRAEAIQYRTSGALGPPPGYREASGRQVQKNCRKYRRDRVSKPEPICLRGAPQWECEPAEMRPPAHEHAFALDRSPVECSECLEVPMRSGSTECSEAKTAHPVCSRFAPQKPRDSARKWGALRNPQEASRSEPRNIARVSPGSARYQRTETRS